MPSLTLKGIPGETLSRLPGIAAAERRSLNQQAIYLIERALADYSKTSARLGPSTSGEWPVRVPDETGSILATARVDSRGRMDLPEHVQDYLGVSAGDYVSFLLRDGHVVLRATDPPPSTWVR
jgi:hypothetical protein